MYFYEDSGGILPVHIVGVSAAGRFYFPSLNPRPLQNANATCASKPFPGNWLLSWR
jgi:hypothetical protein